MRLRLTKKVGVPTKVPTPKFVEVTKPIVPTTTKGEKETFDTKLLLAVKKVGKKGMDVLVGQKMNRQRVIGKNLPAFKALRRGQRFTDENIEASFRLKPTGKKAKGKDIKPFNPSFKFRGSKANPLFVVERRKFRLDSSGEVTHLKAARKAKVKIPSGFFPKAKKKRRKKK